MNTTATTNSKEEDKVNKRNSIKSTYDSRKDGLGFKVRTAANNKHIRTQEIADPFINTTIKLSRWDTFKGLLMGGVVVSVMVSGRNSSIEEDVMDLDENNLSLGSSTRRDEFTADIFRQVNQHIALANNKGE